MAAPTGTISPDPGQSSGHFAILAQASKLFGEQGPATMTIDIKPGSPENIVRAGAMIAKCPPFCPVSGLMVSIGAAMAAPVHVHSMIAITRTVICLYPIF